MPEPTAGEKLLAASDQPGQQSHELFFGIRPHPNTPPGAYVNTYRLSVTANIVPVYPELQRENDSLEVMPDTVLTSTEGLLDIATTVTEEALTGEDIQIKIGEAPCTVSSAEYDTNGHLAIQCTYTAIALPGEKTVTLSVHGFTGTLSGQLNVQAPVTIANINSMQEITAEICHNTPSASIDNHDVVTSELVDLRDGATYTVAKLADGKCWMTQNLTLGGSEEIELTSDDSDVTAPFTLPIAQTKGKRGWNSTESLLYDTGNPQLGMLYNWPAATAGGSSICPRGWTLPSQNDYLELMAAYGWENQAQVVDTLTATPFSFTFTGGYYYGYGGTANGQYWTSTTVSDDESKAFYLKIESVSRRVFANTNMPKSVGSAIRCIAKA